MLCSPVFLCLIYLMHARFIFIGSAQELLLRKDDLVSIVKDDEEWVLVKNLITLATGFVPKAFIAPNMSLSAEEWFFGPISRQKVGGIASMYCSYVYIAALYLHNRLRSCWAIQCVSMAAS
jgi:hypothetical protein